jgi:radical SAM protein with 4Fe4S-binding SPASM domain
MLNDYHIDDVNFMVSLFCPGKCLHCGIWKEKKADITRNEMDPALISNALKSEALQHAFYFDLTAGESQLSPRYTDIVTRIAEAKPEAFIHTNISGWYPNVHFDVTRQCLEKVAPDRFRLDISLDGRPENYARVRLVPGGFEKVMHTVELLRPLGCILRFVFIVHPENMGDIRWIVDKAGELGVDYYIGYSRRSSLLRNTDEPDFPFSPQNLEHIEQTLTEVGWLNERRQNHWYWAKSAYQKNPASFDCHMGRRALAVDPYGGVFPCNELLADLRMGSLVDFNGDLDRLLASPAAQGVLRRIAERKCQPCDMLCAHKIQFDRSKPESAVL